VEKTTGLEDPLARARQTDSAVMRKELDRVLSSKAFEHADRARSFLRYIVEETIEGRGHLLKEYSIGIEVFGKDPSFDPRTNTIVRTEARRLRSRLTQFYETEGSGSAQRIVLKKGGYLPALEVPGQPYPEPAASLSPSAPPSLKPRTVISTRLAMFIAGSLVLFLAAAYAYLKLSSSSEPHHYLPGSIAVLPFANLAGESNQYLSDGITEDLIDSLGRLPGVRVVGRASVFQFKGKTSDLREIGNKLHVENILEGSVQAVGDRVRIAVWLDDTSSGFRIWSQTYDRDLKDALIVQREIADAITTSLGTKLNSGQVLNGSIPISSEAYKLYLKGRYFWNRSTPKDLKTAIDLFEQAIAKDPNYAPAYVGLAGCYIALPTVSSVSARNTITKLRDTALRTLMLDETLGEAHFDLAWALQREFLWDSAEQEYKKGQQLSPGSSEGHRWYGGHLIMRGRLEEGLAEIKIALDFDPVSLYGAYQLGEALRFLGRFKEATDQYRKTLELDPNFGFAHLGLGLTYLQQRVYGGGLEEVRKAKEIFGEDMQAKAHLGYAYAVSGNTAKARQLLHELQSSSGNSRAPSSSIAEVYLGLGERIQALQWLSRALDEGESPVLKSNPLYEPLRSDPRFPDLLARMKLL
jgi:TolB-like protein/Tfp pilus assembly protein PilF